MKKIQMLDLASQYHKIKEEVDRAMINVVESTAFIKGPEVKKFQEELESYLKVKHVVPCANGTDALQMALMALGLKPGDEVITANFTFAATVEVIHLLGMKSVLVDVNEDDFTIDIKELENAITSKTRAIIPVHLFGQCSDMEAIMQIAEANNIYVIEDTAQAIGSDYKFKDGTTKKAGTIGDIGTTSFFPSKNLGCFGDGGALMTNNNELAKRLSAIANHGMFKRYYHDEVGVNSRLDSIQAAVLRIKLRKLDEYNCARRDAAIYYSTKLQEIEGITPPIINNFSTHVFHQYTLKLDKIIDRDALRNYLADNDVPSMIYYPLPLHKQKAYLNANVSDNDFPVTMNLIDSVISLPMCTELSKEQQDYVIKKIKEFINK
jgi:dTDP-4-amino-4,6-dideoxygalactose transaminase